MVTAALTIDGAETGRNKPALGAGLTAQLTPALSLFVDHDARLGGEQTDHAVPGGSRVSW